MFTHIGTQTIKTNRLTLRRYTVDDAQAMFNNWANDPAVTEFLTWQPHGDITVSEKIIESWIAEYPRADYYHWAIVLDSIGQPIGDIAAVGHDDRTSMIHIGYALGKKFWHQGYMSESLAAVIEFFFTQVGINRIESQHDPNNPHSGGVMKKCGMIYEGTRRQGELSNKGIVDACMYSILKDEWSDVHTSTLSQH